MSSAFLTYLMGWELHHFPQPFLMLVHFLHDKKFFLMFNLNLPQCILRPFPLVLSLVVRQKWSTCSSLHLLWWSCRERRGFLSASFSPDWTLSSLSSHNFYFLAPSSALSSFSANTGATQYPTCSGRPKTEHSIQGKVSPVQSTFLSCSNTVSDTSQDAMGLLATWAHWWLSSLLSSIPRSFSTRWISPSPYCCMVSLWETLKDILNFGAIGSATKTRWNKMKQNKAQSIEEMGGKNGPVVLKTWCIKEY